MCLVTRQKQSTINSSDISCYKVLMIIGENKLVSPIMLYEYKFNELLVNEELDNNLEMADSLIVDKGFYHAYTDYEEAKILLKKASIQQRASIFKAVIPANSKVFVGIKGDICTNQIKIVEKM